jgi:hypothetical protein
MDALELRPLAFGEIIDGGFKLYTRHFKQVIIVSALVLIPLGVIGAVTLNTSGVESLFSTAPEAATADEVLSAAGGLFASALGVSLLTFVGTALLQASVIKIFAGAYDGRRHSWQDSLRFGLRRVPAILVATLAVGLASGLGLILCIAPGVWLWTSWYVTVPTITAEQRGPFASMKRSFALVKPRFWTVLGVAVVAYILTLVVQQVVGTAIQLAAVPSLLSAQQDPAQVGQAFGRLIGVSVLSSTLVQIFTVPFLAAVATIVYFDLRVRSEGYDLERLVAEMESVEYGTPPPQSDGGDPFGLDEPGEP